MSRPGSTRSLRVVKLGGGVLATPEDVDAGAREVLRLRSEDGAVLVVVSALRGRTDALLEQARSEGLAEDARVARIAAGELEAVELVDAALREAGVEAALLDVDTVGPFARGGSEDADPVELDDAAVRAALAERGIALLPGYLARGDGGRRVLLGRGGSDLTAVFAAHRLGCACRLVKAAPVPLAEASDHRGSPMRPDELEACAPGYVQAKALAYAARHGVVLHLAQLGDELPLQVT